MDTACEWGHLGNLPNFSPTSAANASVAFATFLAVTVLAVSVQVVFQRSHSKERQHLSVAVAPVTFVVLVASAYEYVRLAGRTAGQTPLSDATSFDCAEIAKAFSASGDFMSQQHVTAGLFAVAGVLLATGGVGSVLILTLVLHEHSTDRLVRTIGSATFYVAAAATIVLLLDGMYEILAVLAVEEVLDAPAIGATGSIPISIVGASGGIAVLLAFFLAKPVGKFVARHQLVGAATVAALSLMVLWPVVWAALLDSHTSFDVDSRWDVAYVTCWYGLFAVAVGLMAAVERRSFQRADDTHQTNDAGAETTEEPTAIGCMRNVEGEPADPSA